MRDAFVLSVTDIVRSSAFLPDLQNAPDSMGLPWRAEAREN